ncbi:glycoside hydrolase family 55 protein [Microbacterium galbinum]|uniref:Glycoside hydrolase family 55 protein n=1 Tax=Microbacterium galbinum TaxID=2851646 RepID=A0ABY4IJS0_9MICO|nr:glycoside hydrolase family 55 protein [Microbacterium galbinum]UPL13005.1 glycoside hydrolase family 55 protein [Microbacterium galbinum]
MATRVPIANLKGPQGIRGERGFPGLNAVPTDEAIAELLGAPDSFTGGSLRNVLPSITGSVNAADFGVVGDGVANDTAALNAAIAATPTGGRLIIPAGTYKLTQPLIDTGRSMQVEAYGATFIQSAAVPAVRFAGQWEASKAVTGAVEGTTTGSGGLLPTLTISFAGTVPWTRGDLVKLWGDDVIPGSSADITPAPASSFRVGQFFTVASVSAGSAVLLGKMRDPMTLGLRVARMSSHVISWRGGTFIGAAASPTGMFVFQALRAPSVQDVTIQNATGQAFSMAACYGYLVDSCTVDWALDDSGAGAYGYGVDDNTSEFGLVRGCRFHQPRHGYSSTGSTATVGQDAPMPHGRTYGARIVDTVVIASSSAAFDTHATGQGIVFQNCEATDAPIGYQLRGNRNRVIDCTVRNAERGVRMASDANAGQSWGHTIDGLYADNISMVVVEYVTRHGSTHPDFGVRDQRPSFVSNIVAREVYGRAFTLLNTTLNAADVDIDFSGPMDNVRALARVQDAWLRCTGEVRFELLNGVTAAPGGSAFWVTGAGSLLETTRLRITGASNMANRLSKVIATDGTPTLRIDDLLIDYFPSTGTINDPTTASSWVHYRAAVGIGGTTSFFFPLTVATNRDTLTNIVARTFEDVVLQFTLAGAQTLEQLPVARLGQKLIISNIGAGTLTINHGATPRTALNGNTAKALATGQAICLIFDGVWRQVTFI